MKIARPVRYALSLAVAIGMFAGCSGGGSQPPAATTTTTNQALAGQGLAFTPRAARPNRGKSWMAPDAKKKKGRKLLYVSDYAGWAVYAYTTGGKLRGQITGLIQPAGMCVDKNQNVYVVVQNFGGSGQTVQEFAHGGTTPLATYAIPSSGAFAEGCAIDPTNGNLAVAYKPFCCSGQGYVAFMSSPSSTPNIVTVPNLSAAYYLGYDNQGNLIVDGIGTQCCYGQLAELPAGAQSFTALTLNGAQTGFYHYPETVQWYDNAWYIGDQGVTAGSVYSISVLYKATLDGTTLTVKDTTALGDVQGVVGQGFVWFGGKRYAGPNTVGGSSAPVSIYAVPKGTTLRNLEGSLIQPIGAVISEPSRK